MRLILFVAALAGVFAAGEGERASTPSREQVAAVDALLPPARRSAAPSASEAASCVRTCRSSAKQEYGVCKNAFPDNRDLCRIVREQRFTDCPSVCGAALPAQSPR